MISPHLIPALSAITGRDLGKDFEAIENFKSAIRGALPVEKQQFVSGNLHTLVDFLKTEEGKIALQTFVDDWESSKKRPTAGP